MTPRVGDLWVVRTGGFVAAVIRFLTHSPVNHAGVYLPDGMIGEAETSGFRIVPNHYSTLITVPMDLTDAQRAAVPAAAKKLVGVPYNFIDIAALAISLITRTKTPRLIERRLSRPDRLICSQACDQLMLNIGVHLYQDGRLPGEVTPADILQLHQPAGQR